MSKNNSLIIVKGIFGILIFAIVTFLISNMFIKSGYLYELRDGAILGGVVSLIVTYYSLAPVIGFDVPFIIQENWTSIIIFAIIIFALVAVIKGGGTQPNEQDKRENAKARHSLINEIFGKGGGESGKPPGTV